MTLDHSSIVEKKAKLQRRQNIIDVNLAKLSTGMGKFRNKLIHEYADVDVAKVYAYLQTAPDQLEQFDQAFSAYLKANKKSV